MEQTPGDRLKLARKRAGYPTAAAAIERFGWDPASTYRSHENGQTPPPPEDAKAYARAYGVTPEWIVFNVGSADDLGLDNLVRGKSTELKQQVDKVVRALVGEPLLEPKVAAPEPQETKSPATLKKRRPRR